MCLQTVTNFYPCQKSESHVPSTRNPQIPIISHYLSSAPQLPILVMIRNRISVNSGLSVAFARTIFFPLLAKPFLLAFRANAKFRRSPPLCYLVTIYKSLKYHSQREPYCHASYTSTPKSRDNVPHRQRNDTDRCARGHGRSRRTYLANLATFTRRGHRVEARR